MKELYTYRVELGNPLCTEHIASQKELTMGQLSKLVEHNFPGRKIYSLSSSTFTVKIFPTTLF